MQNDQRSIIVNAICEICKCVFVFLLNCSPQTNQILIGTLTLSLKKINTVTFVMTYQIFEGKNWKNDS